MLKFKHKIAQSAMDKLVMLIFNISAEQGFYKKKLKGKK